MPGTKIINVLKDDSFKDILDLFRKTDAEDVVFVLPKRSAVFKREDHFAAFASEARRTGKQVSIMCSNPEVNDWAHKYAFSVISKGGQTKATAVAALSDEDEEVRDPNLDAFDQDVAATSDETMGVSDEFSLDEADGMHVESGEETEPETEESEPKPPADEETDKEDDFDQVLKQYGPNDMEQYDEEGNLIRAGGSGVRATLAVSRPLDGVRAGGGKHLDVKGRVERTVKVGVKARPREDLMSESGSLDYIDAVWRDTVGSDSRREPVGKSSRWSRIFASRPKKEHRRNATSPDWRGSGRSRTFITVGIIGAGLIGGAFLVLSMGNATIQIVPVSRDLEFELNVQSSDAFGEVDPLFNKIPGQVFEIEKSIEREFSTSGSQEVAAKSKGAIIVSNTLSESQTLIATTRFEDIDGRVFRTLRTITVPGAGGAGPGTTVVDVIGDKPGAEHNIEPTTFTIPAFKEQGLTDRFNGVTGTSEKAFVGGALGLSGIVTQGDMDDAIAKVTEELRAQVSEAFDAQAVDLELINSAQVQVAELVASAEVGQAVDSFTVSARGILSTVGYRADDLFVLLKEHAVRNWQLTILPEQTELHFDDVKFVEDRGILSFSVTALSRGYARIDEQGTIEDIRGKNRQEVRDYFRSAEDVRSSTVLLSPIWVRSVPHSEDHIDLEVLYESGSEL